tara:strand:+ start:2892 stop:3491 length:600 start_codon:yes stop_codon:yes gene_type:complete
MKKVFLDGGFNKGQSLDHFINIVPDAYEWEIHAFEPDDRVNKLFDNYKDSFDNIVFHKEVIWTTNEGARFYFADTPYGNTVIKEKTTGRINENDSKMLPSIDLAEFIKTNFKKNDYIILKLDIEGREYKLLQHLYDNEVVDYIDDVFVEFHEHKVIKSLHRNEHDNIVKLYKGLGFEKVDIAWEKEFITLDMIKKYSDK